ncbi:MAG TPA: CHAT domain-containing protein [Thermoanaerobaculia bacterium]|jgi:hypothetical protein|nr:CHAT domain-containing protein [Thermoanaerobaculia bacterium]
MNEPSKNPCELQILVRRNDVKSLSFEVRAEFLGLQNKDFGSVPLEGDPKAQAQDELSKHMVRLSDLAAKGEDGQESARLQLADLATALFQNLPPDLRDLLWLHQGELETLQILSDEPYIPFELMKLQGEDGEEGPYLCEAFRVTRWLRTIPQPTGDLPLRNLALVQAADSGLPSAPGEKDDLEALFGAERVASIQATVSAVKAALGEGDFDGWHFSGHNSNGVAKDPNLAAFYLDDDAFLTPTNIGKSSLQRLRPLLFLNACSTGQGGFSLTGLGGWAKQSLAAGATAFLGTLWKVRDQKARAFAHAFYRHFLGGEMIGDAVWQARMAVRDQFPGDPAWLAYTVYARPGLRCSTATEKPASRELRKTALRIPALEWRPDISPPGALLRAEYSIVPFHGREKERSDLYAWCTEGPAVRVRLYTGPGGMGKTRLALEIAKVLKREGWRAGFLEPDAVRSPEEAWKAVSRRGGKVLAIVDYAETRRELLIPLLRRLYATDAGPIRVILLARAALDWWEQLKAEGHGVGELLSGPATSRHSLPALAFSVPERSESYRLAGQAFAQRLNRDAPTELPEGVETALFERVLLLHMAALASIEGVKVKGEDGVLDYVLKRETRYWTDRAIHRQVDATLVAGIGRAMAAITLGGGVRNEEEALEVLRRLQAFQGQTGDVLLAVARLLHECYPGDHWIEPILPDLLGEHLVQREMERGADELLDLVLGKATG